MNWLRNKNQSRYVRYVRKINGKTQWNIMKCINSRSMCTFITINVTFARYLLLISTFYVILSILQYGRHGWNFAVSSFQIEIIGNFAILCWICVLGRYLWLIHYFLQLFGHFLHDFTYFTCGAKDLPLG